MKLSSKSIFADISRSIYRRKMKSYHIYLEGKVLFKDLNDDEFDVIWGRIYKSYFKDDLTYSVIEDEVLDLEPSF